MDYSNAKALKRNDDSLILHFDYDCFYASVFEVENPALRSLPLAVQQKQIIVTCNYEARRRGLYKLQLITEAKRICPEVIIVLGEDLTRFRNASKDLYKFLRSFSLSPCVERLGFDEVFLDVTDLVRFNYDLLNRNNLQASFFCLSRVDPTSGFPFDATNVVGYAYSVFQDKPSDLSSESFADEALRLRLVLGSHLAEYLRLQVEQHHGYTSTVGISTSKLLAKLVGNLHKPQAQTTLLPPYSSASSDENNVTAFLDDHEIGKIPGIGFKLARKIREYVLGRPADFHEGLVYGATKEDVSVKDVRTHPGMNAEVMEKILAGPGAPHGIGYRVWCLVNGIDDSAVAPARDVPTQISIEDSYLKLNDFSQVLRELTYLGNSLIKRMRTDLTENDDTSDGMRWLAFPKTLRLSTRPRPAQNPDGSRNRSFARISRSSALPNFVFNFKEEVNNLVEKLVVEALIPLFKKLHPEKRGWDLSLINVAVTDMVDAGGDSKASAGRDISKMFKNQDVVLQAWKTKDAPLSPTADYAPGHQEVMPEASIPKATTLSDRYEADISESRPISETHDHNVSEHEQIAGQYYGSEDLLPRSSQATTVERDFGDALWDSSDEDLSTLERASSNQACPVCGAFMPAFAMSAHERFHEMGD